MVSKKCIPYSAVLELTLHCNMKCIHCGSSAGTSRTSELTTQQWITVCDELHKLGCKEVTLIGGEVFLRKDWFEIATAIRSNAMNINIVSNGYGINKQILSQLKSIEPHAVGISIDGGLASTHDSIRGVKGSYKKCLHCLHILTTAGIPTTVVTTIHALNIKELPVLRDVLLHKGVAWQIQIADTSGRFHQKHHVSKNEFYSIALFIASTKNTYSYDELAICGAHCIGYHSHVLPPLMIGSWKGCQAGMTVVGIQSDGNVKGCLSLSDSFIEGNIKNTALADMWNSDKAFTYNRKFHKKNLQGDCMSCTYGKTCKGGCLAVSTSTTTKLHGDPFCLRTIEKELQANSIS